MSAIRVLHVDDEPDIREVVDMSLGLDPDFEVRACSSGAAAIEAAAEWSPFLILLDFIMPGMDGPTTLAHLRGSPQTSDIPVLFMTARAQAREVEHIISLGAQGVICKPFDPMTLAVQVHEHFHAVRPQTLRGIFLRRAKTDAVLLSRRRSQLTGDCDAAALSEIQHVAHGLADAAALLGLDEIVSAAGTVKKAATVQPECATMQKNLAQALDRLIAGVENEFEEVIRNAGIACFSL